MSVHIYSLNSVLYFKLELLPSVISTLDFYVLLKSFSWTLSKFWYLFSISPWILNRYLTQSTVTFPLHTWLSTVFPISVEGNIPLIVIQTRSLEVILTYLFLINLRSDPLHNSVGYSFKMFLESNYFSTSLCYPPSHLS